MEDYLRKAAMYVFENRLIYEEFRSQNRKLQAVKHLKEATGLGLRDAKEILDQFWDNNLKDYLKEERKLKLERLAKIPLIEEIIPKIRNLTDEELKSLLFTYTVEDLLLLDEKFFLLKYN